MGSGGGAGATAESGAIATVRGEVLGHQDDLAHGRRTGVLARGQGVDLGQHLAGGARALLAPERRDGAEAADPVAALGHLDVGPRGAGGRAGQLQQVEAAGGSRRIRRCPGGAERDRDG